MTSKPEKPAVQAEKLTDEETGKAVGGFKNPLNPNGLQTRKCPLCQEDVLVQNWKYHKCK